MPEVEFFSPPEGDTVINPKPDWLRDLVLQGGADFWNAGAGQGSLKYIDGGMTRELLLTYAEEFGFYLEYIDPKNTYYVSIGDGDFKRTIDVEVGGDPLHLPSAYFVPKPGAWAVAEEFCRDGSRSQKIRWARRSEQDWNYSPTEE